VLPIPWFWGTQKKRLHAERLTSKAQLLIEKSKFDEALALLAKARKLSPKSIEVEYFCGIVALDLGKPADALSAFERVTSSDPNHARAHNNRGSALLLLGRMPEAEACFCKALAIDPKLSPPRVNLVHLWQRDGRREQAARLCSDAIEAGIDVPVFRHHLAAIEGVALGRADDAWVRSTFDNFAHGFDHVLQDSLGYKVPSQLAGLLQSRCGQNQRVLDLGCGTGLVGTALARNGHRLSGIDLSQKMLDVARAKNVYDSLELSEIHGYLSGCADASFDVVVAADVLIYIGDLQLLFKEAARVTMRGGWFAFSIEVVDNGDFQLLPSGRYGQTRSYIRRLAAGAFDIVEARDAVLRQEDGEPVQGCLYLLRRIGAAC
jgi:predicted TPR repeat methyltransferase